MSGARRTTRKPPVVVVKAHAPAPTAARSSAWRIHSLGIWTHEAFAAEPFTEREAWRWLIDFASWRADGELRRGEHRTTHGELARAWSWVDGRGAPDRRRVQSLLDRWERLGLLEVASSRTGTRLRLVRYEDWQGHLLHDDEPDGPELHEKSGSRAPSVHRPCTVRADASADSGYESETYEHENCTDGAPSVHRPCTIRAPGNPDVFLGSRDQSRSISPTTIGTNNGENGRADAPAHVRGPAAVGGGGAERPVRVPSSLVELCELGADGEVLLRFRAQPPLSSRAALKAAGFRCTDDWLWIGLGEAAMVAAERVVGFAPSAPPAPTQPAQPAAPAPSAPHRGVLSLWRDGSLTGRAQRLLGELSCPWSDSAWVGLSEDGHACCVAPDTLSALLLAKNHAAYVAQELRVSSIAFVAADAVEEVWDD